MTSPPPKRPRWRRIAKRLLLVGVALSVLGFLARKPLASKALHYFAEADGGKLEFSSLEGNLWSWIELRKVRYQTAAESASEIRLQANSVRVEYSIPALLEGGLAGLLSFSTQQLEADVRIVASEETSSTTSDDSAWPEQLPELDLDVKRLALELPDTGPIDLRRLKLTTDPASPEYLELDIARVLVGERATSVHAGASYESGRLELDVLELGSSASLTGFLESVGDETTWDLSTQLGQGHFTTSGRLAPGVRQIQFDTTSISLRDIAAFGRTEQPGDATGILHLTLGAKDNGKSPWPALTGQLELLQTRALGFELDQLAASIATEEAGPGSWSDLQGEAALQASGLHVYGRQLDDLSARLQFDGSRFVLNRLSSVGPFHELIARGEVTFGQSTVDLQVDELRVRRDEADLALAAPTQLILEDGFPASLSLFDLQGSAGRVQVRFDPEQADCIELTLSDLNSGGLRATLDEAWPELRGLNGSVQACRTATGWSSITADLSLDQLLFQAAEFDCSAALRGEWSKDRLSLNELRVEREGIKILECSGSMGVGANGVLEHESMGFNLVAQVKRARDHIPARWREACPVDGDLEVTVSLEGTPNAPNGSLRGELKRFAFLGRSDPKRTFLSPTDLTVRLNLSDRLTLEDLLWVDAKGHELRASGALETGSDFAWLDVGLSDRLRAAELSGSGSLVTETPDEIGDWLRDWFGVESNLRSGRVEGNFELGGTLESPEPVAHLRLSDGAVRAGGMPPITNVNLQCEYADERFELSSIRGELGAAPFEAEATASFASDSPTITAKLRGNDLLLVRNASAKVRADVDLELQGTLDALVLSGKVVLAQGRIVSPLEVLDFNLRGEKPQRRAGLHLFRLTDSPFKELRFDVDIRSRGKFEIDNNVAKGSVRPDLRLTGTGEVPTLSGTLYIDRTLVKLPANDLTVRSGSVRFDEADPFFPRLEIKADARIKGYDVLVTVLGPYDKPEVVLSSTPPLPAEDLIVLVLAGQTPGTSASRTGRAAAQSVAVYLAKDYLARWLSSTDPDDDASWLDRFDFQTGRDITRSGAETLEASFRFDEDRFIERDAIYLTAESDQYDFINFGVRIVFRFP